MDKFTENRFGFYKELSIEELEIEKEILMKEIDYLLKVLDDKKALSEQKSEIINSDLKYEREKLQYINLLLPKEKVRK